MSDPLELLRVALGSRYEVEGRVGEGGMAVVYRALDRKHERPVAIKALKPLLAATIGRDRFLREIRLTAQLQHPLILPLIDSGEAEGLLYYVMPFVEGESLKDRLAREALPSIEETREVARDALEGLAYAHERGIIHRDIKPANLLLTSGHAILADFGIAKALEEAGAGLTQTGFSLGTPHYMSPEQAMGEEPLDGRADLYSLGCVLFEMLAGRPPFRGGTAQAVLAQHAAVPVPELSQLRPGTPPDVAAAVSRALAKAPGERFASAPDFAEALGVGTVHTGTRSRRAPPVGVRGRLDRWLSAGNLRRVAIAVAVLSVLGTAITVVRQRVLEPGSAYAVPNPRRSFVVVPFRTGNSTPDEQALVVDAAEELTRQLNGWESARAVPQVALTGLKFDLGLTEPTFGNLNDGIALARSARVGTLITLTVRTRRDTVHLEATLFDAATGEQFEERPLFHSVRGGDPYGLVAPVAHSILGLGGAPAELETLRRQSNDPDAVMRFREGVRDLERWELDGAERHFEAAIERDSGFALAHHYLGLTLYWRSARDRGDAEVGPRVERAVGAALRHASGLPAHDSLHLRGFHALAAGRYDEARVRYDALLARDSTDVYAWLLLGSVEYEDPWAEETPRGGLRPRANTNLALRAFSETVRLAPDFYLGYGHMFDLQRKVASAIYDDACDAFEAPGGEVIPLFEPRRPERSVGFCPVVTDSVRWVPRDEFARVDRARAIAGADSLLRSGLARIRRWAQYASDQPRPEEELATWHMAWRQRLGQRGEAVERIDSVTERTLYHAARAAGLRTDTTPSELARLAALYLAAGRRDTAALLVERARGGHDPEDAPLPRAAANLYVAWGQSAPALEILVRSWERVALAMADSEGRPIPVAGVEPRIAELMVYGALGWPGPEIGRVLDRIERTWAERYTEDQVARLRTFVTPYVGPALVAAGDAARRWLAGLDDPEPLWQGHRAASADREEAARQLARSLAELRAGRGNPTRLYLHAVLAQRSGKDSLAVALFEEMDAQPGSVSDFDASWGLASLSRLLRARSLDRLGRTDRAAFHYARFVELWSEADEALQPLVSEAREAGRRLGRRE